MAKGIKDAFPNMPQNEDDLVVVSDELWKLGNIEEIRKQVSAELFAVHIGMNIIGNHQCDGWEAIFRYQSQMIPYIPQTLDALHLPDIKAEFQNVLAGVSEITPNQLPEDFYKRLEVLDNLSDSVWGLSAPQKGWGRVINYVKENYNA